MLTSADKASAGPWPRLGGSAGAPVLAGAEKSSPEHFGG